MDCLYSKALQTQFLHLEDIFVTGILRNACKIPIQRLEGMQLMWSDPCNDETILIHEVSPEKQFIRQKNVLDHQSVCELFWLFKDF